MLITTQDITDTLTSYANDHTAADDLAELLSTMHEVRSHIETARTLVQTAMMETPGPMTSPTFEALAIASSHLWFALSAWED